MQVHVVGRQTDARNRQFVLASFRASGKRLQDQSGWDEISSSDWSDPDAFDHEETTHILISVDGEVVGGSRLTPLTSHNLLQTVYNGLVQGEFPAPTSLGADWTRFFVDLNRCEGTRRVSESAVLLFEVMKHALYEGYCFITFVSSGPLVELARSMGWTVSALGPAVQYQGQDLGAYWIEVSSTELELARLVWAAEVAEAARPAQLQEFVYLSLR